MLKHWITKYRTEVLLFLLLLGSYAYFYQSTQHNEAARFDQLRAIVENHTLQINQYWWNTADVIHYPKDGSDHIYPNKAPGMTLINLVPYVAVSCAVSSLTHMGFPPWAYWHTVVYLTTLLGVGTLSALAAVAIYRIAIELSGDRYFPLLIICAIWLGTLVFPYSTLFFSHAFAGSMLALAFFLLFRLGRDTEATLPRRVLFAGGAGLLLGFSVAAEYPTILLAAALFGYALWLIWKCESTWRARGFVFGACLTGAVVAALMLLLYNQAAFGKPLYIPYESYARSGADFSRTYSRGWLGLQWNGLRHFFHALATITIYPQIGMLYLGFDKWRIYACNPVLWLCLPGFVIMLWKRELRLEGLLIAGMTFLYVLFVTCYGSSPYDWAGASYCGSRHLVPLLPFLALPLYFGARIVRPLFYPLLAISVFYMLIVTATEPRVAIPYENTARDLLVPNYLRSGFAQNTDALFEGQRNFTKDSAAFNIGKLLQLPPALQLIPLLGWWLLIGGGLLVTAGKSRPLTPAPTSPQSGHSLPIGRSRYFPRAAVIGIGLFVVFVSVPPFAHWVAGASRYRQHGLLGKYYRNGTCSGDPAEVSVDSQINFDWTKTLPLPPPFSIEWTGSIAIERENDYQFGLVADDGAMLEIDGKVVVDVSQGPILQKKMGMIHLTSGLHPLRLKYFNPMFGGLVKLSWIGQANVEEMVPTDVLVPPPQTKPSK